MDALIKARTKAKLTHAELAARLGIDRISVWRYEAGTRRPAIKVAYALNEMFKIPMATLRPDIFDKNYQNK